MMIKNCPMRAIMARCVFVVCMMVGCCWCSYPCWRESVLCWLLLAVLSCVGVATMCTPSKRTTRTRVVVAMALGLMPPVLIVSGWPLQIREYASRSALEALVQRHTRAGLCPCDEWAGLYRVRRIAVWANGEAWVDVGEGIASSVGWRRCIDSENDAIRWEPRRWSQSDSSWILCEAE